MKVHSPACPNPLRPAPWKVCCLLLFVLVTTLSAVVVRPAPNVNWIDSSGRQKALSAFKGQPVVLLIAPSPRDRSFRSQLGQLRRMSSVMRRRGSCSLPPLREREGALGRTFPSFSPRTVRAWGMTTRVARDSDRVHRSRREPVTMSPTRSSRRSALTICRQFFYPPAGFAPALIAAWDFSERASGLDDVHPYRKGQFTTRPAWHDLFWLVKANPYAADELVVEAHEPRSPDSR